MVHTLLELGRRFRVGVRILELGLVGALPDRRRVAEAGEDPDLERVRGIAGEEMEDAHLHPHIVDACLVLDGGP